mgnify:FL=1|tara:strand:- start:174585 stop:175583 length:999 start_codon:yes stop_codon:yes gene_type:complete
MGIVSIIKKSGTPKYKQIVASFEEAISSGTLKKGDKLPSLNSIKNKHSLSRDTVLMAFNELKTRGIVQSIAGKGYYVMSENINVEQKIFLLFDELNGFKEDLYNSFVANLGFNVQVDIYFHHFNQDMFSKLIYDHIGDYSFYVIMPANLNNVKEVIEKLPNDKVYIIDQTHDELAAYPSIYQNFEKNMFDGLTNVFYRIKTYRKIILIFSARKEPQGMLVGFKLFCSQNSFEHEIISSLKNRIPEKGEVYVILDDRDLLRIIKDIKQTNLILGKDVGIISYNETLLKEVVEGGITTISTNFNLMGERLAQMIITNEFAQIENPNGLIIRKSV